MTENMGREFGWEDPIENDSPDFILLPEGDYDFDVVNFERGRHSGSDKLPPCNKATIHIRIDTPEGTTTIRHNLFLHSSTEGMLCTFFTGIGQRKKGERFVMNWNTVAGSKGRCKVGIREYEGRKFNQIVRFYEPEDKAPAHYQAGRF